MYKTKEEVESWLKKMNVRNYIIYDDLTVDVNDNVNISYSNLHEIPVKFKNINGKFSCEGNYLKNLKNGPDIVFGNFNCKNNKLTNLNYCPKEISGSMICDNNDLTSLEGCPKCIKLNDKTSSYYLSFDKNKITEKELINIDIDIDISNFSMVYSDFNKDGDKEEFINIVNYYKNIKKENELLNEIINKNSDNIKIIKKL